MSSISVTEKSATDTHSRKRHPHGGQKRHRPPLLQRRRIRANAKEMQIFETITLLGRHITEWFDVAPEEMHEAFDRRFRKRIGELID